MSSILLQLAMSAALVVGTPNHPVPAPYATDSTQAAIEKTMVEVDNRNFNDATVYAVQGLRSVRLGWVTGFTTEKFVIPDDMVRQATPIHFVIRPLASRRSQVSDQIMVSRGDLVGLYVSPF